MEVEGINMIKYGNQRHLLLSWKIFIKYILMDWSYEYYLSQWSINYRFSNFIA